MYSPTLDLFNVTLDDGDYDDLDGGDDDDYDDSSSRHVLAHVGPLQCKMIMMIMTHDPKLSKSWC